MNLVDSYASLRPSLDEVRWTIAHECAHIKHEDGIARGLGMGLGLVAYHGMRVPICFALMDGLSCAIEAPQRKRNHSCLSCAMHVQIGRTGTTKLLWRRLGAAMHRGSSAPGVRAALVCAGPVLVGLAQVQLARQQEYAADRTAVRRIHPFPQIHSNWRCSLSCTLDFM